MVPAERRKDHWRLQERGVRNEKMHREQGSLVPGTQITWSESLVDKWLFPGTLVHGCAFVMMTRVR